MHLDLYLILGSAVVGFLVGLTGAGGGALMTPMLVMLFGISPLAAISSDLVAAVVMKPAAVVVHWRQKSVHAGLVRYLCYGSVPGALAGTYVLYLIGSTSNGPHYLQMLLGAVLGLTAIAMIIRAVVMRARPETSGEFRVRRKATIALGVLVGFMVGLTSVGAGALMLVLLLGLYPAMRTKQLVGTDLAQAIPLSIAAAAGALFFGEGVHIDIVTSVVIGSVPMAVLGSLLSARVRGQTLRAAIGGVVLVSGLHYVGVAPLELGISAVVIGLVICVLLVRQHRIEKTEALSASDTT